MPRFDLTTNCEFCGKAMPTAADGHIGERACCAECKKRLAGDLCTGCLGTGSCCSECGTPCAVCQGEGLRSGAPCPYSGPMTCDSDDCEPCAQRLVDLVDDWNDARREQQQIERAGAL